MSKPSSTKPKKKLTKKARREPPGKKAEKKILSDIPTDAVPLPELPEGVELDPSAYLGDNKQAVAHAQIKAFLSELIDQGDYLIFGVRRNKAGHMRPFEFTSLGRNGALPAQAYIDAVAVTNASAYLKTLDIAQKVLLPAAKEAGQETTIDEILQMIDAHTDVCVGILEENRSTRASGVSEADHGVFASGLRAD